MSQPRLMQMRNRLGPGRAGGVTGRPQARCPDDEHLSPRRIGGQAIVDRDWMSVAKMRVVFGRSAATQQRGGRRLLALLPHSHVLHHVMSTGMQASGRVPPFHFEADD